MNQQCNAVVLTDLVGVVSDHSTGSVLGLYIAAALVGSLTFVGVTAANGSPQSWVVPPASVGSIAVPGSAKYWGRLTYVLTSASDSGKPTVSYLPL